MAPKTRNSKAPTESGISTEKSPKMTKSSGTSTKRKAADDVSNLTKKTKVLKLISTKKTKIAKSTSTENADVISLKTAKPKELEIDDEGSSPFGEEEEGQSTDDENDDEDVIGEEEIPIAKVPKVPKHRTALKGPGNEEPGVIYIGRVPHGFYEHQMRAYFSQFGDINKLRLSRNKKTGASKHYAFIEFAENSTAEIVAKTMNDYKLFEHVLKVKMVPKDQVNPDLWKGSNRRYKIVPWGRLAGSKLNRPKTEEQWNKSVSKEAKRRSKLANKLTAMDYEFAMPTLAAPPKPAPLVAAQGEEEKVKEDDEQQQEDVVAIEAAPEPKDVEGQEESLEDKQEAQPKAKKVKKSRQQKSRKS